MVLLIKDGFADVQVSTGRSFCDKCRSTMERVTKLKVQYIRLRQSNPKYARYLTQKLEVQITTCKAK